MTSKFVFFTVFGLRCFLKNCLTPSSVNCCILPRILKSISIEKLGTSSFSCSMLFIENTFSLFTGKHFRTTSGEKIARAHLVAGKQTEIVTIANYPFHTAEYATTFLASDWLYFCSYQHGQSVQYSGFKLAICLFVQSILEFIFIATSHKHCTFTIIYVRFGT